MDKGGRKLIVVDVRKTMSAEMADYFIQVEPNKDYELMQALRALVRDEELDVDTVAGVPVEYLKEVADALVNCEFGVIFFGMGLTQTAGKFRNIEVAISTGSRLEQSNKIHDHAYERTLQRYRSQRCFCLAKRLPIRC